MAITINASPATVWAWLVQMGHNRAGWYSWDRLDNWGRRSSHRIHPEWQKLSIGDHLSAMPDSSMWWEVVALDPQQFLGLRALVDLRGRSFDPAGSWPKSYSDSLWGFQLKELPSGGTRLVVSGYWNMQPRWLQPIANFFLEPAHWIMQVRQFANLKRRAERESRQLEQAA
jgi:proline iminopeptidase